MLYLIRHGQTDWSQTRRHTGLTDRPLTEEGKKEAYSLGHSLANISFSHVFTSPLRRAKETCHLAGFTTATIDADLVEWDYGSYEGLTTHEIQKKEPGWNIFLHGAPGGESVEAVKRRADRFLEKVVSETSICSKIAIFSSAHLLRTLAVRWLKLEPACGKFFLLSPASISILGFEHREPAIIRWNDIRASSIYTSPDAEV